MATALQIVRKFYPEVEEIRDALRGLTIHVTKRDSNAAAVKNHKDCALAVACKREKKADAVIICVKASYLIHGTKAVRYTNPESVSREVVSFDRNAGFEPGIYHLSKVAPANRLGIRRQWKKSGRTAKEKMKYHRTENVRILE